MAAGVHIAEAHLRARVALVSRLLIPLNRFSLVLRNASTEFVRQAERVLRDGVSLIGGLAPPRGGLRHVMRDA